MTAQPEVFSPLVAVLGGGQLGRMLGLAGVPLGVGFRFLDPSSAAPARDVGELVVGELDDAAAARAAAAGADVVTYEWEGVPAATAQAVVATGVAVYPPPAALAVSQDRLAEKTLCHDLGIPVAGFAPVADRAMLARALGSLGMPAVLKTRRGGYDGKGQRRIGGPGDVEHAWQALHGAGPLILEAEVSFDRELAILAVRGLDGDTRFWAVVETTHRDGMLRVARAPASKLSAPLQVEAETYATKLLDRLDYVGVLAVELFEVGEALVANEIAPRVHNSGHSTIEGAATSQFENHVRALLGWPLGATNVVAHTAMVNCIDAAPDPRAVLAVPGAHLHRYTKTPRPGRKMGHVTVTADSDAELDARLAALPAALRAAVG